jgi:branched-chain amino acid transport system substrate-binding protein
VKSKTFMAICSIALALAMLASGCAKQAGKSETYKIGALVSVTGAASALGLRERETLEMMAKQANEAGGIKGPDGALHPVELVLYDTESEETKAVMAAKKLINEDKVLAIIGPTTTGESLAIMDTVQRSGIVMIAMASDQKIVQPIEERKWAFKVTPNNSLNMAKMGEYFAKIGVKTIAYLGVNNAYGEAGREAFEMEAPNYGLEIVAQEKLNPGDADMTAQLTKIKGMNPDALVIYAVVPELAIAAKNAHDLGLDMPIVCQGGVTHPKFVELAGKEAVEDVLFLAPKYILVDQLPDDDPQKAEINLYKEQFRQEYGDEPDTFGAFARDAWLLLAQAIERAGGDRAAIRDALEEADLVGCSGIFDMSPSDHSGLTIESVVAGHFIDGTQVVLPD